MSCAEALPAVVNNTATTAIADSRRCIDTPSDGISVGGAETGWPFAHFSAKRFSERIFALERETNRQARSNGLLEPVVLQEPGIPRQVLLVDCGADARLSGVVIGFVDVHLNALIGLDAVARD